MVIRPFDVLLQKGTDFGARLIQFFTRSPYSHAGLALPEGLMIHSTFRTGCAIVNFETWKEIYGGKWDVYRYKGRLTPKRKAALLEYSLKMAGGGYDWRGVLSFVFPWMKEDAASVFCSELIAQAYECAGIPLVHKPHWRVSPGDLAKSPNLKLVGEGLVVAKLRFRKEDVKDA